MSAINRLSPISVTSRRAFLFGAAAMAASVVVSPSVAVAHSPTHKKEREVGAELASQWVRTLYKVVQSEGLTPPAAARFYHYTSLTMYEAARPTNRYRSLAKLLHGLEKLPKTKSNVNDATVLSEAVANVALGLLPNASDFSRSLITPAPRRCCCRGRRRCQDAEAFNRARPGGWRPSAHLDVA